LSAPEKFGAVNKGDMLVLIGAVFWSFHVLIIDHFAKRLDPLKLSAGQFAWCALFSLIAAFASESITWTALRQAALPILYGGLASVGVGYTLQVVAQRDAPPAHSAVLMCLEGAFATLGGVLLLSEQLTVRTVAGSALMLVGMLATQWDVIIPS
jgi:drug/metabolite transporter (DMT)-like permease